MPRSTACLSKRSASGRSCALDRADALCDGLALIDTGDMARSVLLPMELAALPGYAGQSRPSRRFEAGMVVGNDPLDAFQAAPDQAVEEGAPMNPASDKATATPSTRRCPAWVTLTATRTAQSTRRPASRTLS